MLAWKHKVVFCHGNVATYSSKSNTLVYDKKVAPNGYRVMTQAAASSRLPDHFVPRASSAHFDISYHGKPQDFYFVVLPRTMMLALSAAIEPLRVANQITNRELYRWFLMTEDGQPVRCSNGMLVTPDMSLSELPSGATALVAAGGEPQSAASEPVLNWLRRNHRFGRRLGAICTGTFALAQAGLLNAQTFTLHWEDQPAFIEEFPDLTPSQNIFEISETLLTCGGGHASTDMMLTLIEERHGEQLAIVCADMCLHVRSRGGTVPQRSNIAVAIGSRNQHLLNALQLMQDAIEDPLTVADLCTQLDISRRQLERLFARYLNQSPMQVYFDMRLHHAYGLMNETALSITEIALASGFNSATHFSRQFKRRFGASPHFFRKGWS